MYVYTYVCICSSNSVTDGCLVYSYRFGTFPWSGLVCWFVVFFTSSLCEELPIVVPWASSVSQPWWSGQDGILGERQNEPPVHVFFSVTIQCLSCSFINLLLFIVHAKILMKQPSKQQTQAGSSCHEREIKKHCVLCKFKLRVSFARIACH